MVGLAQEVEDLVHRSSDLRGYLKERHKDCPPKKPIPSSDTNRYTFPTLSGQARQGIMTRNDAAIERDPSTMRISLTVTAGPNEGQVFTFDGHDTFIVG